MKILPLTDKDYRRFSELVYRKSGINLGSKKKELVRSRFSKLLREKGLKSFSEYYKFVVDDTTGEELIRMINAISTNVTSFFREPKHFTYIETNILSEFERRKGEARSLRIWSAGCSTGEEPYTISISLREYTNSRNKEDISFSVFATDLSTSVLEHAMRGVYLESTLKDMPLALKKKYFQKGIGKNKGFVKVKPFVKEPIFFRQLNLMKPFGFDEKFHIIFCRNVLIYFTEKDQQRVVESFYENLNPGGHLFIGHSESLLKFKNYFKYVNPTIYKKPL